MKFKSISFKIELSQPEWEFSWYPKIKKETIKGWDGMLFVWLFISLGYRIMYAE